MHNFVRKPCGWRAAVLPRKPVSSVAEEIDGHSYCVDDDASIRRALRRQLQILGFDVLDFGSAEEFLTSEIPTGERICCLTFICQR